MFKSSKPAQFIADENGAGTVFGLFLIATLLVAGGYAIDVSNLMRERTHLQSAADSTAHAAIVARELRAETEAKEVGIVVAQSNMPTTQFGNVVNNNSISFGVWDEASRSFQAQAGSRSAVQVVARRTDENENSLTTFLMHMVGVDAWNVTLASTYATYRPTCFREGFVSTGVVDLQSGNSYFNGFCIHSNEYVSINSNNYFEAGTVVSMPDLALLEVPNSGYATNEGLEAALREGSYHIRILSRIDDIIATIDEVGSRYRPDYITTTATKTITKKMIDATDLVEGRINYWNCNGDGKGTITNGTLVKNLVIVSNCAITFGQGVQVQDAVIATTNPSDTSFKSPSGFTLGRDDDCATGGGAQLVTMGGMNFAANLQAFGGQLLAVGAIEFAADADGIEGVAMVSAGGISGTSNMEMGFCGSGMEDNFEADYFRMVD